jgi:predicted ATPase
MSIRLLEVEGFKSLKEVSWRPGSLNVIIGPNGSGKSNLLQLLQLIRATAAGRLSETVQQDGGIDSILWDGRTNAIQLAVESTDTSVSLDERDYLRYEFTLKHLGAWSGFQIPHERLESFTHRPELVRTIILSRDDKQASMYDSKISGMISVAENGLPEEEAVLSASYPLVTQRISSFIKDLKNWGIYKGLNTSRDAPVRQAGLTRREMVVSADGDNLLAVLHTLYTENRDFRGEINTAMRAAFNDNFEELIFPPAADQRVQLRVNWKYLKRSQPSAMLSDGTLHFLYLMAILASPEPPSLIAIEEPEVGLHPSMFPIIAEYAAQASKRTQVIFTTHSADFLDAFRDTGVAPTTTVTQWRDGATTLKVLEGEELAYWLREYTLGQLFRSSELEQIG